ncbi:MAG TPA: hypothetical protein VN783_15175, partial [Thermoanaerobaculia bacterium]|nr:hypothetical protein [Thermoanaerobaculia bacterium]
MPSRWTVVAVTLALGLAGSVGALAAGDKSEIVSSIATGGLKLGAEKFAQWAAGRLYNNECKSAEHEAFLALCGALGQFSGEKEKEWKAQLSADLAAIRGELDQLRQGQARLQTEVETLVSQNKVLLAKVDTIVDETVAQSDIRIIQTLWNQQFLAIFGNEASFSRERLLRFAREVIAVQQIHTKLGVLTETLTTRGTGGKQPLLRLYANQLAVSLAANKSAKLLPAYDFYEGIMTDLLVEQRKGFLMYVWAAEILESECEIHGCSGLDRPPITALEFKKTFDGQIARELDAFNASLEWLVLARSDGHAAKADFLPAGAVDIFWRADLLTAANTDRFGLRGRVIGMGDTWDGKLALSGRALAPAVQHEVPIEGEALDWWRATGTPLVFDEVRFANAWRVLHYDQADQPRGSFKLDTNLPWKQIGVFVTPVDLRTGQVTDAKPSEAVVLFGSFIAIERAGGGYALLSGDWDKRWDRDKGVGLIKTSHLETIAE